MNIKRKYKTAVASIAVILTILCSGCGDVSVSKASEESDKLKIVCTAYPQYDWIKEIIGENEEISLTFLLRNGSDLHNYQPSAEDIARIGSADIFVYTGGESDRWVEDSLKEAVNKEIKKVNLFEVLGEKVKEEELVEGMQEDEHTEHEDDPQGKNEDASKDDPQNKNEDANENEHELEYDEHIWLSLKNAETIVEHLAEILEEVDPASKEIYRQNADEYINQLKELDQKYQDAVSASANKTVLFADRFPFLYLMKDYQIDYYAAFAGCSAETEASFETITFLSEKLDELKLKNILVLENSDQKIAELIRQNTETKNQEILVLNSIQSVTEKELENGFSYLTVMQDNLEVLQNALKVEE